MSYDVPHHGSTVQVHASIVAPLDVADVRTVRPIVTAIIEMVAIIAILDQPNRICPVPSLLRPLCVRCVACVSGEPRGKIEEAAIGDGVLVVVAAVEREDLASVSRSIVKWYVDVGVSQAYLPSQASSTSSVVPSSCLRVGYRLCKSEPLWTICRRIWKVDFGCSHDCHTPEALIVISKRPRLVGWHIVPVYSSLMQHCLRGDVVVCRVACVVPVVD